VTSRYVLYLTCKGMDLYYAYRLLTGFLRTKTCKQPISVIYKLSLAGILFYINVYNTNNASRAKGAHSYLKRHLSGKKT
jgi:hypothetical protein